MAPAGQDIVGDRTRLLGIGMTAVFSACVVFALLRLGVELQTGRATPWWGNAAGAVAIACLYLWYRGDRRGRLSAGVHGTALVASVALIIPAAYGMTSSKWWLALVGFSVTLMGRRREALVWMPVTVVLLPTVAILEPYIQVPNASGEPAAERALAGLFFVVLLMGMTQAFRRVADGRARELSATAASLARANAVKSRFLAHMSHEVRTPLHGVIAMTDLAMEGETSPTVRHQIETAQQSARVLLDLLNNVLEVARAESDALHLELRPFLLHAALSELLRPLAAQAEARGLRLSARADAGLAEARVGDRARLAQIALNLTSNALKFTRQGSIDVRLRPVAGAPDRIALEVSDTGVGIPADKLEAIFQPFEQVHESDSQIQSGAGLGLAIVRELAHKMDGSVRVTSEPGRGSTFAAELFLAVDPAHPERAGPEDLLARSGPSSSMPVRPGKRSLSVLACEDNAVNQLVLRVMLERLGHKVRMVDDGQRAWDLLQNESFDVVVTDIEMPGLDGVELTRRVREREREAPGAHLPIIGATAHVGEAEKHRLLDAGLDAHLPKPFVLTDVAAALDRVSRD